LSERARKPSRHGDSRAHTQSHKGAEASWRGFHDKRQILLLSKIATGFFGFSETSTTLLIVQSSIAKS
jgi:hypothetical protein